MVLGGSLGSKRINQLIEKELEFLQTQNVQIIWQCGKLYFDEYKHFSDKENVQVLSFIDRMDLVYAAADIVISRSGASSVSELAIVGKPVIFIPSPNVSEDHQTKNAMALVEKNAAILVMEVDAKAELLAEAIRLIGDIDQKAELIKNIETLGRPNATSEIVNVLEGIAK